METATIVKLLFGWRFLAGLLLLLSKSAGYLIAVDTLIDIALVSNPFSDGQVSWFIFIKKVALMLTVLVMATARKRYVVQHR